MNAPQEAIRQAYKDYDREVTISKFKVACVLGMILVPSFVVLDYQVYPKHAEQFLYLRLLCSAAIGVFLAILLTPFGRRHYRFFGVTLVLIPAAAISYMIYTTQGPESPYYAGLNLVLLVVGFVLNWTFRESLVAVSLVLAMYLGACFLQQASAHANPGLNTPSLFANNLYFLGMTGIIVVTGTYFLNQFRYREFVLRFQLDQDRRKLEENNRKLKELDELKSHFFANISHELRTPLTLLLAPLETLLRRPDASGGESARELLRTMQANGMRLLKLINDLLDLVRLESGVMDVRPEPIVLPDLLQGLVSTLRPTAHDKQLELTARVSPELGTALLDRDKLEKILLNLLFNALKFTPAGGRVELRATREADELVLEVADTGIGIPASQLPNVFRRFWQADSSARRKHPGTGIGLALVKELTEAQGGRVSVHSVEGHGTTFTVRLNFQLPTLPPATASPPPAPDAIAAATPTSNARPLPRDSSDERLTHLYRRADFFPALSSKPDSAPARAAATRRPSHRSGTVLVADDEPGMRGFLASQLREDYAVIEASNGREAVERAVAQQPDVILLDMMMPDVDGLQACRELRQAEATRSTPVLILTARADDETKLASLSAGASDFLTKPFSTTELGVRVRNLVASTHLQRELAQQNAALAKTIEQLKETEIHLVQAEKLASLGRLTAGIIHEINNPLNFATTGLYSLRSRQKQLPRELHPEISEILTDIEDGLRRVKNIVADLRSFSHPSHGPPEDVPLRPAVDMALRFLSHEWKDDIAIEVQVDETLQVRANHNRLVQVFVNLLQNSVDALRQKPFTDSQAAIRIQASPEENNIVITVHDNGPGIEPAILGQIFDPFFTTKEVGKGLGLGLSITYRILQEFGGSIRVRSEPGAFTEFTLRLLTPPRLPSLP